MNETAASHMGREDEEKMKAETQLSFKREMRRRSTLNCRDCTRALLDFQIYDRTVFRRLSLFRLRVGKMDEMKVKIFFSRNETKFSLSILAHFDARRIGYTL